MKTKEPGLREQGTHEQGPREQGTHEHDRRRSGDEISGLVRRVRRRAKLSQRELAHDLGVSQSAVAKWETGRTTPSARMLARVLEVARLSLSAVDESGETVRPMAARAARDAAGRRYPAHTFVWAEGWWAPLGSEMTSYYGDIQWRSEELEMPRVRYSRWWQCSRRLTVADLHEHPTWRELVAEARQGCRPRRHRRVSIPSWAFQDTRKSRNRRPVEFRALARSCRRPEMGSVAP